MAKKYRQPKAELEGVRGARIVKRKGIDTDKDPYLTVIKHGDLQVCGKCGSIYHDKRWVRPEELPKEFADKTKVGVLCPACRKMQDEYAEGYITLEGDFLKEHKEEVLNLIHNKEAHAEHFNPLDRIIKIKDHGDSVEITTTTEKLALRIGQILEKTYRGKVEFKWSDSTRLARVVWKRDDDV